MEIDKNKILLIQKIINSKSPSYKEIKEYRLIFHSSMRSGISGAKKLLHQALVDHFFAVVVDIFAPFIIWSSFVKTFLQEFLLVACTYIVI